MVFVSGDFPRIFGPYVLVRSLGAGSGGAVYLARPTAGLVGWPSQLVVKVLLDDIAQNPDYIRRFEHEARIAVHVDHPNVVKVLESGAVRDVLYIAMEHVDGTMLSAMTKSLAQDEELLPLDVAVGLLDQALAGVEALHDATDGHGEHLGFVHRDLSPRNIMVDAEGVVRLIDLGLGKSRIQEWRTVPGTTLGSAGYMPPEQAAGDPVEQDADLYALGAIAHELLLSRRMIAPSSAAKMLHATMTHRHVSLRKERPDIPPALDAFVERATASTTAARFESAAAMRAALRACGITPATADAIGRHMRGRFGPVRPVPLDDENPETSLTRAPPDPTVVFARREGLFMPETAASMMFEPTRAEMAPHGLLESAPFASEPIAPPQKRRVAAVVAVALTAMAAAALVLFAPPPQPLEDVAVVDAVTTNADVTVTPKATAAAAPVPEPTAHAPKAPETRAPRPPPRRAAPPSAPEVARPAKPAKVSVHVLLRRLEKRADALRTTEGVPKSRADEASRILLDLTRVSYLVDNDEALARMELDELAQRLDRLERP